MDHQSDDEKEEETLYDLIKDADFYQTSGNTIMADDCWEKVMLQGKEKEEEVKRKYEDGTLTILSMTISYHAPYNVVEMISGIYPEACRLGVGATLPLYLGFSHMDGLPEWERVIELLMRYYPEGIKNGESDTTALHMLLEHQPSIHLVQSMVECHRSLKTTDMLSESRSKPKRSKVTPLLLTKDENDSLPFHVAVEYQASDDVIGYLLSEYPNAVRDSRNHDGCLPLHIAIIFECTGVTLSALVRAYPEALKIPTLDEGEGTPLHLIFNLDKLDDKKKNDIYDKKKNNVRWSSNEIRANEINSNLLSGEATCKYLLAYHVKSTKLSRKAKDIKKLVNIRNAKGQTVLQSALECAKVFPVPESLLNLLQSAAKGAYTPVSFLP